MPASVACQPGYSVQQALSHGVPSLQAVQPVPHAAPGPDSLATQAEPPHLGHLEALPSPGCAGELQRIQQLLRHLHRAPPRG